MYFNNRKLRKKESDGIDFLLYNLELLSKFSFQKILLKTYRYFIKVIPKQCFQEVKVSVN